MKICRYDVYESEHGHRLVMVFSSSDDGMSPACSRATEDTEL